MPALQILYKGNVQGVGFRYTVKQIAKGFEITGFVRNLHDGGVELQAAGDEQEVRGFLDAISASELRAHIQQQTEHAIVADSAFRGFEIRHD